ncbi:PASTA domain-containing protein [Streptomyces sp. NPDC055078]
MAWNQPSPQQPPTPWGQPSAPPPRGPGWARKRVIIPAAVALFLVGIGIGSAGSGGDEKTAAGGKPAPTVTVTANPAAGGGADTAPAREKAKDGPKSADKDAKRENKPEDRPRDEDKSKSGEGRKGDGGDGGTPADEGEKAPVPDFVGMGLQAAQDRAQSKGFYRLTSHDSTGDGRMQVLDRNWRVCTQDPRAGRTVPTDTELNFGAVKVEESCP